MKIKTLCKVLLTHLLFFSLGTILFISLFHTKIFRNIDVFFYRGIALLILSTIILFIATLVYRKINRSFFTFRDVVLVLVLFFCLNLVFFTHIPVTAERSISIFLLKYLDKSPEKLFTEKEIIEGFTQKYLYENNAIQKRLYEQIVSKNIIQEKDTYKISKQGRFLVRFYEFVTNLFNVY